MSGCEITCSLANGGLTTGSGYGKLDPGSGSTAPAHIVSSWHKVRITKQNYVIHLPCVPLCEHASIIERIHVIGKQ